MEEGSPQTPDIERMLARLKPPAVPDAAFNRNNEPLYAVRTWKRSFAVSTLAGLLTDPAFHANAVRLDWLQRLALSKSAGERRPKPQEIGRAVNAGLSSANVLRLEDPQEDLFCDLIATHRGNFRIFNGHWECPGPYTQTLLHAFESLPPSLQKDYALQSVYALLTLSEELAQRANVHRLTVSGGEPQGVVAVPDADALKQLAQRVRFTNAELTRLGVSRDALTPYVMRAEHYPYVSSVEPGDSPLEFHPLLENADGVIVASPAGISLAIRAVLVNVAKRGGVERLLLANLLAEQERYTLTSGFWPPTTFQLSPPDPYFLRNAVLKSGEGRLVQIIQVPVSFDQFPQKAFASVRVMSGAVGRALADLVTKFWETVRQESPDRDSATVLLLSGWGTPHSIGPPIDRNNVPANWQYIALSFSDLATLGTCEDGNLFAIQRIVKQVDLLEHDGFSFQNMSGMLNLFGFWRSTKGNLIPEHMRQIVPPCNLLLPTDELLAPRIEAAQKHLRRALPLPDGSFKLAEQNGSDDLQPVYASLADIEQGRLLGALELDGRVWWLESPEQPNASREWRYRTWHAVLQWLGAVGRTIIQRFPDAFPVAARQVSIRIPSQGSFERMDPSVSNRPALAETIVTTRDANSDVGNVQISGNWLSYLGTAENDAEIELVAATLEILAGPKATEVSRDVLRQTISEAIGSRDWRWLHAREAFTPLERLARAGLLEPFQEIPLSAFALAKCGSTWGIRTRSEGLEIEGEDECRRFLALYRSHILNGLISKIRNFNRITLVSKAAGQYQAARFEQSQWQSAIRAMRAIHGADADQRAFKRQNSINAVQRAAKSIMEVAACEAAHVGGMNPDRYDLEELFAHALLLFGNGQIFASIRAGLVKPSLRISPAGDLLSDRSIFETTLTPAARWSVTKALNESDQAYGRNRRETRTETADGRMPIDDALRKAIEAEYGASAEAFADLQFAILQMAEVNGSGVLFMRRSELIQGLRSNTAFPIDDPTALLARLTLPWRRSWSDLSEGFKESDFELSRFDRPFSLISRPLLALDDGNDSLLLVTPMLVSDATMYAFSGLMDGNLQNQFWVSAEAKSYVGMRAEAEGLAFEERVAEKLRGLGLRAWTRCKLSWALNEKVPDELGDIDVLSISSDRTRVWVIEAKDLRLCRTEVEVAARLSEYRGRMVVDNKRREKPDELLRHIQRVQYLRMRRERLCGRLELAVVPEVRGLLIVDAPQPMNFYMLETLEDGQSAFLDSINSFSF